MEWKSDVSFHFFIFLLSFFSVIIGAYFYRKSEMAVLCGLIVLLAIPAYGFSLVLALMGLRKCAKYPGRHLDSRLFAILTLVFGGLFGLVIIPAFIQGIRTAIAGAQTRSVMSQYNHEPLDFKSQNFIFHQPKSPWRQLNAPGLGRGAVLAFGRPRPVFFTVAVHKMQFTMDDPQKQLIALSKTGLRHVASSYKLVDEHESTYNATAGWQIESEAAIQGHDFYFVHWLYATNGFGYQLATWGPPELKSQVLNEAVQLNQDFELVQPQN
jgi:hypothetical protein